MFFVIFLGIRYTRLVDLLECDFTIYIIFDNIPLFMDKPIRVDDLTVYIINYIICICVGITIFVNKTEEGKCSPCDKRFESRFKILLKKKSL